jgi:hypothetical protein
MNRFTTDWLNSAGTAGHSMLQVFLTLPTITQYAVTLLLLSGAIAHLFKFTERTVHDGPTIFTTAGIFFTFLGIAEGLYGFDPQKIDASIPILLEGLKTAFIASVVGVGAALSIKLRYALFGLRNQADTPRPEGATVNDLFNQLVAVRQSLVGDDESTLLTQIRLTRQDQNDRLDRLQRSQDDFARKVVENNSRALIEALQQVIRDFNTKISEQFGENFKQLNEAVGRLLVWQTNYRTTLDDLIAQQTRTAESMTTATEKYVLLVGKTEVFVSVSEQLFTLLNGLELQRNQLSDSLKSLADLLAVASTGLPQLETKIMQLTEQMTYGVKAHQDTITKTLRDSTVEFHSAIADVKNLLLEATQNNNRQINDHIKQLSDRTNEQISKMDRALEIELSKSISSLGRQLTALSKQFVDDYRPLTDKLRKVVQAAGAIPS